MRIPRVPLRKLGLAGLVWVVVAGSLVLGNCGGQAPTPTAPATPEALAQTATVPTPTSGSPPPPPGTPGPTPSSSAVQPSTTPPASRIGQVWVNEGGDKVTRDELRATNDPESVLNSVWDGTGISLFGARNEVVAFDLVLEAPGTDATDVNVSLAEMRGPGGATIATRPASGDALFDYVGRNIEWQNAAARCIANPSKRFYVYNGHRPATGSFATEDDGVAPRMLAWVQ